MSSLETPIIETDTGSRSVSLGTASIDPMPLSMKAGWVAARPRIESVSSTTTSEEPVDSGEVSVSPPQEQLYPHLFDESLAPGEARMLVTSALRDANLALDAFGDGDLAAIESRLALVASTMKKTHHLTSFNESYGSVVTFIRRATLRANAVDVNRSGLNALVQSLRSLSSNPSMDLDEAADLIDLLSDEGWKGEHEATPALLKVLFDESDLTESENLQPELFVSDAAG